MNLDPTAESQGKPDGLLRALGGRMARIPHKALLLGLFLLVAVLMAVRTATTREDCSLRVRVQHSFHNAHLFVWLDDKLVYSGPLIGTTKSIRSGKKKVRVVDTAEGSLSETFPVPAGAHDIRVRVEVEDGSAQENSIRGDFTSHGQRTLSVLAKANDVSMNWDADSQAKASTPSPGGEPAQAPEGWFQRYSGALLVSIVGSIVSAFTGYVIKELPKKITSAPAEPPKSRSASAGQ